MRKPKCPKCGCKRYRNVGEIACYPGPNPSTKRRVVMARFIECMKCGEVYPKKS